MNLKPAMLALAERLWEARRQGTVVRSEDVTEPASTEEAYAIQRDWRVLTETLYDFQMRDSLFEPRRERIAGGAWRVL